ncbi:hypothetical protein [Bradyrhizobium brasilense]|uniref:hypothetical protein n=1 Tax=Bradyrhizobium brasilense TaxID=1419277 RepID=UPI001E3226C7|nr:hypothetical protein [Bradyrhizobium brasilense]MCC8969179.1 hypothetical protein [Bradyrhizobium brasilense]
MTTEPSSEKRFVIDLLMLCCAHLRRDPFPEPSASQFVRRSAQWPAQDDYNKTPVAATALMLVDRLKAKLDFAHHPAWFRQQGRPKVDRTAASSSPIC